MNEVEKMYENTEIKKVRQTNIAKGDYPIAVGFEDYPPFTAEKQIELIKWLAIKGDFDSSIDIAKNTYDYWTIYFEGIRWTAEGFEESLAGLINNLWQDLTEEERKQIKNILESGVRE